MSLFLPPPQRRATHRFVRCAFVLFSMLVSHAFASPSPLSMREAQRLARDDAPMLAAQSASLAAAQDDAVRAGALPDPVLRLGVDNLTATGPDAFAVGADLMTMRRVGVVQAWPSRQKREARTAVAQAQVETLDLETEAIALQVELHAGLAWLAVWEAQSRRDVLQALIAEADLAVEIARAQVASGTAGSAAALAAQAERAELENALRRSEGAIYAARASLARWVNDQAAAELGAMPDFSALSTAPEFLRQQLNRHAALQVWQGRAQAADGAVELARAGKRPDLGFGLSYGARSGRSDMLMFEVSVGLPLFAANRQDRDIGARLAERDAVEAQREDAIRAQRERLEQGLAAWESLREERSRYAQVLVPLASDRSAVALAAFRAGAGIRDWIEARRDELQTRTRHIAVEAELGRVWLQLDSLLPRTQRATGERS